MWNRRAKMYHISNDKRSKESSTWIYEALERLMQKTEYKNIKITDLCNEAKIGRVTFYRHYDTIDDVLRKKCDEKCDGLINYIVKSIKSNDERISFLQYFLRYWYDHSNILALIYKADRASIISESLEKIMYKMKPMISLPHPQPKYMNYFFAIRSAIPLAILAEWVKNDLNITPDELSEILSKMLNDIVKFSQMD